MNEARNRLAVPFFGSLAPGGGQSPESKSRNLGAPMKGDFGWVSWNGVLIVQDALSTSFILNHSPNESHGFLGIVVFRGWC